MTAQNSNNVATWQTALAHAIHDPKELLALLELDESLLPEAMEAMQTFSLVVPRGYVERMEKGNPNDPLLRQVLPIGSELLAIPGYSADPLQEAAFNPIPGLLHKYHGRVLLTIVGTCAINCRFCFRRLFPYGENNPGTEGWQQALDYIANNPTINEVILSGGDPLVANDRMLETFTSKLNQIPHLKRLRIHSRIPIVLPERITPEFLTWIGSLRQQPVLVTHANHPQEINQAVRDKLRALTAAGVTLLNQSVLLKGVNDDVEILAALSEALFAAGVQPYYLHLLDKVQGAAHFDLPLRTAQKIYAQLNQRLSGYLVPRLVYEQPGATGKLSPDLYTE